MAGETTSLSAAARKFFRKQSNSALSGNLITLSYSTTQNELNDVMEAALVPAGVTIVGFLVSATDMDTNVSPAVVHQILLDTTALVSSITVAQGGTSAAYACAPTTTTAPTLLKVKTTTAAATAAAGTLYVTPICFAA